jgi:hypothetical protein
MVLPKFFTNDRLFNKFSGCAESGSFLRLAPESLFGRNFALGLLRHENRMVRQEATESTNQTRHY